MPKRAVITGITGQDGSYLAELLLSKGYQVHGLVRRASTFNTHRIDHIYVDPHAAGARFFLHYGDLGGAGEIAKLIQEVKPDELYHLAAQSHVRVTFVSRKVTRGVAAIMAKRADKVFLGNLDAKRDWGYAPEYVECMWKILQAERPDDFVIGTGEMHTVRELVEAAFSYAGLDWKKHVELDRRYLRPLEVDGLQADASKARTRLGWTPRVRFTDLVKIMVDCDLELMGCRPVGEGKKILQSAGLDWTTNRMTAGGEGWGFCAVCVLAWQAGAGVLGATLWRCLPPPGGPGTVGPPARVYPR